MTEPQNLRKNYLLDALPADECVRLFPHLKRIPMAVGEFLYEPGDTLHYAYFPTTCIVSLLYLMENGASSEIAMIGNEGLVGVSLFMGGGSMPNRAVVNSAGYAYRLSRPRFMQEFNRHGALYRLLLHYTQTLMTHMAQTAVCNRHHTVEQQFCRWLLHSLDRLSANELIMTQESIANMLGVRRESVTEAAGKLQQAGLVELGRGRLTVLDRTGLEDKVCECYQVVKTESDRLIHSSRSDQSASQIQRAH